MGSGRPLRPPPMVLSSSPRGTNLDAPPFFSRIGIVKAVHLVVLAATYGLALAFYPLISHGLDAHPYFAATYIGSIAASAVLSTLALLSRPGMLLYGILVVRVYLLVVLGYSIEAFHSARLVLGIGLMMEIGILVDFPWALVAAGLAVTALAFAQAVPFILGSSACDHKLSPTPLGAGSRRAGDCARMPRIPAPLCCPGHDHQSPRRRRRDERGPEPADGRAPRETGRAAPPGRALPQRLQAAPPCGRAAPPPWPAAQRGARAAGHPGGGGRAHDAQAGDGQGLLRHAAGRLLRRHARPHPAVHHAGPGRGRGAGRLQALGPGRHPRLRGHALSHQDRRAVDQGHVGAAADQEPAPAAGQVPRHDATRSRSTASAMST